MIGCPRAAAAVTRWVSRVSQLVQRTPLWPASWLPVLVKSRGSKLVVWVSLMKGCNL